MHIARSLTRVLLVGLLGGAPAAFGERPSDMGQPDAAAGKRIFHDNCILCHGGSGQGNGMGGGAFQPKPADLTDSEKMAKLSDDQRAKVIRSGGRSVGASKVMPAFKDLLSDEEIQDLVAYIRQGIGR